MNGIKEVLENKVIKQMWFTEQLGKIFSVVDPYILNKYIKLKKYYKLKQENYC